MRFIYKWRFPWDGAGYTEKLYVCVLNTRRPSGTVKALDITPDAQPARILGCILAMDGHVFAWGRKGLTQEQLAEKLGISVRNIQHLEGIRCKNVKIDTIAVLAKALGTKTAEFFEE